MIPIRDTLRSGNYPVVNTLLIVANVLVYLVELGQGRHLEHFFFLYGLVPARYSVPEIAHFFSWQDQLLPFLSFMFLHGGFWHLLGNMWTLYIFGDNVEDHMGPLHYLFFYVACGIASGLTHLALNWHSQVPTVGASGAIAGVMGAYFVLYPRARILTLIPIFFIPYFLEIPAFFFLGLWFLIQFLGAAGSPSAGGGIAWWAHVGGFLFGILFLKLFSRVPEGAMDRKILEKTVRHTTPRLQILHPTGPPADPHLYGTVRLTPREALGGTYKIVNIPWGFHKRLYRVRIPPGTRPGTVLRLAGLGKRINGGERGDLYLRVEVA